MFSFIWVPRSAHHHHLSYLHHRSAHHHAPSLIILIIHHTTFITASKGKYTELITQLLRLATVSKGAIGESPPFSSVIAESVNKSVASTYQPTAMNFLAVNEMIQDTIKYAVQARLIIVLDALRLWASMYNTMRSRCGVDAAYQVAKFSLAHSQAAFAQMLAEAVAAAASMPELSIIFWRSEEAKQEIKRMFNDALKEAHTWRLLNQVECDAAVAGVFGTTPTMVPPPTPCIRPPTSRDTRPATTTVTQQPQSSTTPPVGIDVGSVHQPMAAMVSSNQQHRPVVTTSPAPPAPPTPPGPGRH
jgi:hypothetical protein